MHLSLNCNELLRSPSTRIKIKNRYQKINVNYPKIYVRIVFRTLLMAIYLYDNKTLYSMVVVYL